MPIRLGATYTDKITGFKGVATGHVEYLTGCSQTLLAPRSKDGIDLPTSNWFDDQRLDLDTSVVVQVLNNGVTPGCDAPAPRR